MDRRTRASAATLATLLVLGLTASGTPPIAIAAERAPVAAPAVTAAAAGSTPIAGWHIQSSRVATADGAAISQPNFSVAGWYRVTRRSTVMAGLIENGRYSNELFRSTNLNSVDKTQFQVPWWYRETVNVTGAMPFSSLRVAGVTSKAEVWLNGTRIATTAQVNGSHNAIDLNVSSQLREGANGLAIKVSPADVNKDFAIGWIDWNPYPPDNNMGIWQDVTLHRSGAVSLDRPRVQTKLAASRTSADLTVKVDAQNRGTAPVTTTINGTIGAVTFSKAVTLAVGQRQTVTFAPADTPALRFAQVNLWWPVGLGQQPLYNLRLDAVTGGASSDTAATTFGIREITSRLESHGYRQFTVNGKPLLLRGGGWASDMFLRYDAKRLEDQFRVTRDMGLNMIRPEGKLEHDEFYDLADRYGILVLPGWECCNKWEGYAGAESGQGWAGDDFRIAAESMTAVAERIRNHPSVAAFLIGSDFAPDARIEKGYLDALTAAEWPNPIVSSASRRSSPQLGSSGMKMDGPYDWVPPNYWYDNRLGAAYGFGSELSAGPGVPELDSLRAMMTPAELDVLWRQPTAKHFHAARPGSQFEQLALYNAGLSNRYGAPTSLQDYVRKAQLANYESTRAQFEAYGERQDATDASHTTGVVYWMLNNAWPSLTWHLYDHSLATDAGYFGAKKANGQTHVQYAYDDRSVVVVNNSAAARSGLTVTASVFNLDGTQKFTQTVNGVSVPALGTTRPLTIPQLTGLSGAYFVKLTTSAGGVETDRNVYWLSTKAETLNWGGSTWYHTPVSSYGNLTSLTSLARTTVSSTVATSQSGDTTTTKVTLRNTGTGPVPAFFVTATLRGAAGKRVQPVAWTDNYVTLWPGESTTLTGTYRTSDLGTATPTVEVTGINL